MLRTNLLLGAHTSTQGGLHKALLEGQQIGATTLQLFTSNQRQWRARELSAADVALFKKTQEETGLTSLMSHASYLINLASPVEDLWQKSLTAFRQEIIRCKQLDLRYLNFHPGAALHASKGASLDRIVASLLAVQDLLTNGDLHLLIETTAGQGSNLGASFEEISYLIQATQNKLPVGVCVDTCHIFAAGYDIRTVEGWEKTLTAFDKIIGLSFLKALHLNDSLQPFNSRKDRHAPLGEGTIGPASFQHVMSNPLIAHLPKYLETPGGPVAWKEELAQLKKWAEDAS